MPYKIKKQKCKQSDGDSGSYVLSYTSTKGKKYNNCHTSKKKAQGQIAAIEGPSEMDETDDMVLGGGGDPEAEDEGGMDEALIREYIRAKLLLLTEAKFGSDQRGRISEWIATIGYNKGAEALRSVLASAFTQADPIASVSSALRSEIEASPPQAFTNSSATVKNLESAMRAASLDSDANTPVLRAAIDDGLSMAEHMEEQFDGGVAQHAGTAGKEQVGVADILILDTKDKDGEDVPRAGLSLKIGSSDETQMNSSVNQLLSMPDIEGVGDKISNLLQIISSQVGNHESREVSYEPIERYQKGEGQALDVQKMIDDLFGAGGMSVEDIVKGTDKAGNPAPLPAVSLASESRNSTVEGLDSETITDIVNYATSQFWQSRLSETELSAALENYKGHFELGDFGVDNAQLYALRPEYLKNIGGQDNENNPRRDIYKALQSDNLGRDIGVTMSDKGLKLYDLANGGKYLMSITFRDKARSDAKINRTEPDDPNAKAIADFDPLTMPVSLGAALASAVGADSPSLDALKDLHELIDPQTQRGRLEGKPAASIFSRVKAQLENTVEEDRLLKYYEALFGVAPERPPGMGMTAADLQAGITAWFTENLGDDPRFLPQWSEARDWESTFRASMSFDGRKLFVGMLKSPHFIADALLSMNPEMTVGDLDTASTPELVQTLQDHFKSNPNNRFHAAFKKAGGDLKKIKKNCQSKSCAEDVPNLWAAASRDWMNYVFDENPDPGWAKNLFLMEKRPMDQVDPLSKFESAIEWVEQVNDKLSDKPDVRDAMVTELLGKFIHPDYIALPTEPPEEEVEPQPEVEPPMSASDDEEIEQELNAVVTERTLRTMIHQRLTEELTRADKTEIARIFKKEMSKVDARKAIRKEIESSKTQTMIDKAFKKQFDKELRKALGVSFFGTPGKINKFVIDEIQREVEKILGDAATKEMVVQICKDVIIKLYRELSFTYKPVIQRLKV